VNGIAVRADPDLTTGLGCAGTVAAIIVTVAERWLSATELYADTENWYETPVFSGVAV